MLAEMAQGGWGRSPQGQPAFATGQAKPTLEAGVNMGSRRVP
jgi:hypothetical protein